jgi:VanZ family protein
MIRTLIINHYKVLTILLLVIITILSLIPFPELPEIPGKDKTFHLLAYAALAFPVSFARPNYWLRIILIFLLWSAVIELIQPYFNHIQDWKDLLANAIGLFIGYVMGRLLDSLTRTKK